jgi:hypothetical protein
MYFFIVKKKPHPILLPNLRYLVMCFICFIDICVIQKIMIQNIKKYLMVLSVYINGFSTLH